MLAHIANDRTLYRTATLLRLLSITQYSSFKIYFLPGNLLMKKSSLRCLWIIVFFGYLVVSQVQVKAGMITEGDLVVYRVGDGTTGLVSSGSPVFVDEYTSGGTLVQSIPLPTTAASQNPLLASGTATSEGLLTVSSDGQYVALTGYDRAIGGSGSLAGSNSTTVPRTVGIIPVSTGIPDTSTALTNFASGNNPRSAVTDGTNIWLGGAANGVSYTTKGSSTSTQLSTTVANVRQVNIFAGQLFTSSSSGSTIRLGTVGSPVPTVPTTSGQTITNLPGFETSTGDPYAYFFADLNHGTGFDGTGLDTLYVADNTAGQIQKFTLSGSSWAADGTITAASVTGLTGFVDGSGNVDLFGTTGGNTAGGGGTLYSFIDTTGNGSVSGTATSVVTLSNTSDEAFRGIAYLPVQVPEPATCVLAGLGLAGCFITARRQRARQLRLA